MRIVSGVASAIVLCVASSFSGFALSNAIGKPMFHKATKTAAATGGRSAVAAADEHSRLKQRISAVVNQRTSYGFCCSATLRKFNPLPAYLHLTEARSSTNLFSGG